MDVAVPGYAAAGVGVFAGMDVLPVFLAPRSARDLSVRTFSMRPFSLDILNVCARDAVIDAAVSGNAAVVLGELAFVRFGSQIAKVSAAHRAMGALCLCGRRYEEHRCEDRDETSGEDAFSFQNPQRDRSCKNFHFRTSTCCHRPSSGPKVRSALCVYMRLLSEDRHAALRKIMCTR
jgi:hypothetical protein